MADISYIIVDGKVYNVVDLSAVPQTRTVNGKDLSQNIVLDYDDVGIEAITNNEIDIIVN